MHSKLTIDEFRRKLGNLTRPGEINVRPISLAMELFQNTEKPFRGQIKKSSFQFEYNSAFLPALPATSTISGDFHSAGSTTEVNYKLETLWFGYLVLRIFPAIAILGINALLIIEIHPFNLKAIVFLNLFLLLSFVPALTKSLQRKKMEKIFIDELKIES